MNQFKGLNKIAGPFTIKLGIDCIDHPSGSVFLALQMRTRMTMMMITARTAPTTMPMMTATLKPSSEDGGGDGGGGACTCTSGTETTGTPRNKVADAVESSVEAMVVRMSLAISSELALISAATLTEPAVQVIVQSSGEMPALAASLLAMESLKAASH
eukprot:4465639-Pleurochrysis_carterae.AAC.3